MHHSSVNIQRDHFVGMAAAVVPRPSQEVGAQEKVYQGFQGPIASAPGASAAGLCHEA